MKFLSREFTRAEKLLLVVLALILVGLAYYQFVYKTTKDTIARANAEAAAIQTELDVAQAELAHLQSIQDTLDKLEKQGELSWMNSYNNAKAEVAFLNDILANTIRYTVTFANVTRSGNQIRRSFTLDYQTPDYTSAQKILQRLCDSENRCLVSDVACTLGTDGTVTMRQTATFYETMVGGVADAGLPADKAKTNY